MAVEMRRMNARMVKRGCMSVIPQVGSSVIIHQVNGIYSLRVAQVLLISGANLIDDAGHVQFS